MSNVHILEEIAKERVIQDAKWGGPEHDDEHWSYEWAEFIDQRLKQISLNGVVQKETRKYWLEIAALAVARIESMDRKGEK